MPVFLSLAAFPLLFAVFWQAPDRPDGSRRKWDEAFLFAATFWAALTVVFAEILGARVRLSAGPMASMWAVTDVGLMVLAWILWRRRRNHASLRWPDLTRLDFALLGILAAYLLSLGAIAWASPPNNVDSLVYHMPRVVHWVQQGSLAHFRTGNPWQLWFPPGAEILILNFRLLAGDDRLANLVQWFTYLASFVGIWWIGRQFGLGRAARWVAVGFAASIPMAVLQSTSTQNDMVAAFWLVVVAGLVVSTRKRTMGLLEVGTLGAALGMGFLTKATFYFACAPLVVWMVISRPWRASIGRAIRDLLIVALLAVLFNAGHASRGLANKWTPVGPLGDLPVQTYPSSVGPATAAVLLRPLQAGLLNFASPSPELNNRIVEALADLKSALGVREERPLLVWGWNHEDLAGSPIHFMLLLVSGACLVVQRKWPKETLAYAICLVAGFALLPIATANALDPFTIRFQLSTLLAWSPLIGLVAERNLKARALGASAVVLLLLALPWVLFNKTRPVIAMRPDPSPGEIPCLAGCTAIGSVFIAPKVDVLFANLRGNLEGYVGVSRSLQERSCRRVGLRIDSFDPEYAWWYLLGAPQSGFHIETVYPAVDPEPARGPDFRPCAIICTICGDRIRLHGLDLFSAWGNTALFLGDDFTWDEDG